ncbi:MAG: hypothetical protein J4F33_02395, partial [Alphaproteobacteria bacterium]|nr:hypothetical protein [Alphaproteobacteria bacterium]
MTDTAAPSATPARPFDLRAAFKEAGIAAFVMLALSLALVAVRVEDVPGGLAIRWRPFDVGAAVVLVFLGRLGLACLRQGRAAPVALAAGLFCAGLGLLLIGAAGDGPAAGRARPT